MLDQSTHLKMNKLLKVFKKVVTSLLPDVDKLCLHCLFRVTISVVCVLLQFKLLLQGISNSYYTFVLKLEKANLRAWLQISLSKSL